MLRREKNNSSKLFEAAVLNRKGKILRRRVSVTTNGPEKWLSCFLWTAFILVGVYILFLSPVLFVQEIRVDGDRFISATEYQKIAEDEMAGKYFGLIAKRNVLFVPSRVIENSLLDHFPLLTKVVVERHFPEYISIHVAEEMELLRWCTGGPCYGVRESRAVLMLSADESRYDPVRLSVIDESALPIAVGATLAIEPYLETFRVVHEQLPTLTSGTVQSTATTPSRYSGELRIMTGEAWQLLLSVERPAEESLGMLRIFLEEYAKEGKNRSALTSVDLRVEGKVFYIEKNMVSDEGASSPEEVVQSKTVPIKKKTKR